MISTVNDNYDDVYHGVREGYSGAYQPLAGDFEESLDYGDIYGRLDDILGLTYRGGYHTQYTEDGGMEFRVWGLDVGDPQRTVRFRRQRRRPFCGGL